MFLSMKCAACSKDLHNIDAKPTTVGNKVTGPLYHAVVATCPHCQAVLGVLNDPSEARIAIEREMDALRKDLGIPKARR